MGPVHRPDNKTVRNQEGPGGDLMVLCADRPGNLTPDNHAKKKKKKKKKKKGSGVTTNVDSLENKLL